MALARTTRCGHVRSNKHASTSHGTALAAAEETNSEVHSAIALARTTRRGHVRNSNHASTSHGIALAAAVETNSEVHSAMALARTTHGGGASSTEPRRSLARAHSPSVAQHTYLRGKRQRDTTGTIRELKRTGTNTRVPCGGPPTLQRTAPLGAFGGETFIENLP